MGAFISLTITTYFPFRDWPYFFMNGNGMLYFNSYKFNILHVELHLIVDIVEWVT